MKNRVCLAAILALAACSGNTVSMSDNCVAMKETSSDAVFVKAVAEIEATVLDESSCLLGAVLSMSPFEDDYVIVDKTNGRISRFSKDGLFLNAIGCKGRGPQEYTSISNIQITGDTVSVFSYPETIVQYDICGRFLDAKKTVQLGETSLIGGDNTVLTYYGYNKVSSEFRIVKYRNGKAVLKCLPDEGNIMSLTLGCDMIYRNEDSDYVVDSYSPTVYKVHDDEISAYVTFDFGKYSIKPEFYHFDDAFQSAEYLMSSDFALIERFICGSGYDLVQVTLNYKDDPCKLVYGLGRGEEWGWFALPEGSCSSPSPLFQYFKDDTAYCLFEAECAEVFLKKYSDKLKDASILDEIKKSDSHVVAKIKFN